MKGQGIDCLDYLNAKEEQFLIAVRAVKAAVYSNDEVKFHEWFEKLMSAFESVIYTARYTEEERRLWYNRVQSLFHEFGRKGVCPPLPKKKNN